MKTFKKWIPICFLIIFITLFYIFNLEKYFSFSFLQQEHHLLKNIITEHFFLSLLIFGVIYIIVAATSLPIAAFLTILGGFLFGPLVSLIVIDISATIGATLLFLTVKTTFSDLFRKKATPWIKKMEMGFHKHAFSYLLFLRLVPLFPFWVVTIVAGLLDTRLKLFFLATLIGIIPGTLVYSLVGSGLGVLLEQGKAPDIYIIFSPEIFWPLFGLAILSLIPILYKKRKNKNGNTQS